MLHWRYWLTICYHISVQRVWLSSWFVDQLLKLFQEAKLKKKIVVCHFYAAWSPTCKAASRIFQKMSIGNSSLLELRQSLLHHDLLRHFKIFAISLFIDFIGGNTTFCRVDIKEVQSLKHTFNIESTPTFKILIAEEQVIRIATNLHLCSTIQINNSAAPAPKITYLASSKYPDRDNGWME